MTAKPHFEIDHVQLAMPVGREDDARAFFVGALGFEEVAKPPELAGRGGAWFRCGDVTLHVGVDLAFAPAKKAHPALRCAAYATVVERLRARGCFVTTDPLPFEGMEHCYVDDPFGNRIELIAMPSPPGERDRKGFPSDVRITPFRESDRERWQVLWAGYLRFYRQTLADDVSAETWRRVVGGRGPIDGFAARIGADDAPLVGFAHVVLHANTWDPRPVAYLEDLYVDPEIRGRGVARALVAAVVADARRRDCARVYWHTQELNATARALYDSVATLADFVRYDVPL